METFQVLPEMPPWEVRHGVPLLATSRYPILAEWTVKMDNGRHGYRKQSAVNHVEEENFTERESACRPATDRLKLTIALESLIRG